VLDPTVTVAAAVPLNVTAVAPVSVVPVMVTTAPTGPVAGVNETIAGVGVKLPALVAVPPGVVTEIVPAVTPAGTVAVMDVADTTVNVAAVPLKATAVAPVRFVPVIVTVAPTGPDVGVNDAIVGAGVKFVALVPVPNGVVTVMGPTVVPAGTVAVIVVLAVTVNAAATPLNATFVAPAKLVPVIVTVVPIGPKVGVNEVTVGATAPA